MVDPAGVLADGLHAYCPTVASNTADCNRAAPGGCDADRRTGAAGVDAGGTHGSRCARFGDAAPIVGRGRAHRRQPRHADPTDDYIWNGRDAILDRYALAVFAVPPPPFTAPPNLDVTRTGDAAAASLGADRWRFRFAAGRWWLQELAY
ncbi:MAG: hypothetical protein IPM07_29720 [Anaerolineales bacterium]|nr:hypothetical protein [Anaerolineales bacterium]